jgi:Fe2+ transport system protein FeoA
MTDRPIYVLRLRPLEGIDPIHALRRLLKFALRVCGMRAISVEEERP